MTDRRGSIVRVLVITFFLNLLVCVLKIGYGHISGSLSMLADGFHSLLDASSNIVGLVAIYIASKPPDRNHSYGHRKFETLAAMAIAMLLVMASFEIVHMAFERILSPASVRVTVWSFAIMLLTMGVNLGVSTYEASASKRLKSDLLHADSRHTLSDFFVSLSVLVGLAATRLGYPIVDTIFAVGIAVFIMYVAIRIALQCSETLADAVRLDPDEVRGVVLSVDGVEGCHNIRSRGREDEVYLDIHITVDESMPIGKAHDISDIVEEKLKGHFSSLVDVVVHIGPKGILERRRGKQKSE
ncbi:MAG: cation diffusion facilitator family transporter [Methermicoccaceae archaeon]